MNKLLITTMGLLSGAFVNAQTNEPMPKPTAAQYISVGPTAGFGGNWVGNMGGESHFAPTGNIGVSVIYAKQEHWGLGGQALFAAWGYDKEYNGERAASVPVYLRLPLRGYYFFGNYTDKVRPKLFLGPEVGIKLGEHEYIDNGGGDISLTQRTGSFRTFDVGFSTGGGVNIELRKSVWLNLDLSYYQGLTDVVKDPAGRHNVNHNLGASAGILFGINH